MRLHAILIGLLVAGLIIPGFAQSNETKPARASHWVVYAGIGPNYYFNNLEVGKSKVNELNYSFVTRFMWEPRYFLSLGFETGYNRLYTFHADIPGKGGVSITNAIIPLQLVVTMKFSRHIYGSFNMGQSMLLNKVSTANFGRFDASILSLGDFAATIGYKKTMNERFSLGAELKGYYSGKLDDKNIALVFMAGYRL